MTNPRFDQQSSASEVSLRQQLIRQFTTVRSSTAWIWLLLVFGWYGLHGFTPWPVIGPDGKIFILALTILILVVCWALVWAGWWIWVIWPIPVITTLVAALFLLGFAGLVIGLSHLSAETTKLAMTVSVAAVVVWAVVMNVLGAGTARSLKRHFQSERAFRILFGVALAGLITGSALRVVIYQLTGL